MTVIWSIVLFGFGLVLMIKGGDLFVDSASWLAEITGVPRMVVGATVVSIATTLPELFVSVMAVLDGSVDMGVGNAVGSVICNLGLILALTLAIRPATVQRRALGLRGGMMMAAAVLLGLLIWDGRLMPYEGLIMLVAVAGYILSCGMEAWHQSHSRRAGHIRTSAGEKLIKGIGFVGGAAAIIFGARLLVDNGQRLALMAGVSEAMVGLTIVAVGTSLPELVTAITALRKGQSDMAVGNIIGANILDLLMILGICGLLAPTGFTVSTHTLSQDLPVSLLLMIITIIPACSCGRFKRWQGVSMLALYGGYLILLAMTV